MKDGVGTRTPVGGVQALNRALELIDAVFDAGGRLSIRELSELTGLPQPTVHRLMRTLVGRGYMRQLADRQYALGFRLVPLGQAANQLVGLGAGRILAGLVHELGETANLAILSGDRAEYVAQAPSPHAMRMFTVVGRRVDLHATGVGKALLAQLDESDVVRLVGRTGMGAHTERTIVTETRLLAELVGIRERGYSVDDEEQEPGVRCVAVGVPSPPSMLTALSISGPVARVDDQLIDRAVPLLLAAARHLSLETIVA
jgi:IclR family transcriptional regulator, acetate operon repressor